MSDSPPSLDEIAAEDFQAALEQLLRATDENDIDPVGGWDVFNTESQSRFEVHITAVANGSDD